MKSSLPPCMIGKANNNSNKLLYTILRLKETDFFSQMYVRFSNTFAPMLQERNRSKLISLKYSYMQIRSH